MMGASCFDGVAWFKVDGYNGGNAFEAYVDTSIDGVRLLLFHHVLYSGTVYHDHPTADNAASGSPGWQSFKLANVQTLLTNMCPSGTAGARFYVGQHDDDGSSLATASNVQWIAWTDKTGSTFSDMFDSAPSNSEFTGSAMRRGDGTTNGVYTHASGHTTGCGVMQCSTDGSVNSNVLFEYTKAGPYCDSNHGWTVWSNGGGSYYNSNRPGSTTRYGWMGVSGC